METYSFIRFIFCGSFIMRYIDQKMDLDDTDFTATIFHGFTGVGSFLSSLTL